MSWCCGVKKNSPSFVSQEVDVAVSHHAEKVSSRQKNKKQTTKKCHFLSLSLIASIGGWVVYTFTNALMGNLDSFQFRCPSLTRAMYSTTQFGMTFVNCE